MASTSNGQSRLCLTYSLQQSSRSSSCKQAGEHRGPGSARKRPIVCPLGENSQNGTDRGYKMAGYPLFQFFSSSTFLASFSSLLHFPRASPFVLHPLDPLPSIPACGSLKHILSADLELSSIHRPHGQPVHISSTAKLHSFNNNLIIQRDILVRNEHSQLKSTCFRQPLSQSSDLQLSGART